MNDSDEFLYFLIKLSLIILATILVVLVFVLLNYVATLFAVNVQFGKPVQEILLFAYRYAYQGRSPSTKLFYKMLSSFPTCRGIKLCYTGPQVSYIEYAYGLILDENCAADQEVIREYLLRNACTLFKPPVITFALHISLPLMTWLPKCVSHWFAVTVGYIKLNEKSQKHNLCGYPVLEIYEKNQISFIVPLLRQDEFIVWEAERIVFGRNCSAMLRPLSILPFEFNKAEPLTSPAKFPRKIKKKRG